MADNSFSFDEATKPSDDGSFSFGEAREKDKPVTQLIHEYMPDFTDIGKSALIGVPQGIIQGAGTAGDIASMFPEGERTKTAEEQVPRPELPGAMASEMPTMDVAPPPSAGKPMEIPTSQNIRKNIEQYTGPFYEPQTRLGKVARETTSFLSNPLSYIGGASVPLKMGTAATAGAASEVGGQVLEGTPLETAARVTFGLIGGGIPNMANKAITRSAIRSGATADDLFNGSSHLYENSYNSGVSVKPQAGSQWAYDIENELRKDSFRQSDNTKHVFDVIKELGEPQSLNQQGTLGIPEIDNIRKALNRITMDDTDKTARAIARYGISRIDENVSNLVKNPQWIATGQSNAVQVAKDITSARAMYAAGMRSNMLEDAFDSALEKSGRRAGSTGKGGNIENVMRQEIRKILERRTLRAGFSADEIAKMQDIVKGSTARNLLRGIGALAPTGIVSGTLGLELGHILFGASQGMLGVPVAGLAAKHIGEGMTRRAVEDVAAMTRRRGMGLPEPQPAVPARGYLAPLLFQSRGGAIKRALGRGREYIK